MEAASPNLCRKLEGADQETQLIPALFYLICLISIKAAVLWAHWQLSFTIETKGTGQALCVCVCACGGACTGYKRRVLHGMLPLWVGDQEASDF